MINTKKAFTLVELIVVITILAILGTIAFISLQGYSADARNSKRTQDLNNLAGSVNIKSTQGSSLLSFVTSVTNSELASASIAGTGTTNLTYSAGTPNYTALEVKPADFKDPTDVDYTVGATTKLDGKFEFAASIENGAGTNTAIINGNYNGRGALTVSGTATGSSKTVTIVAADINKLYKFDTIADANSNTGTITKISSDGLTITTSVQMTSAAISLAGTETLGLIDAGTSSQSGNPVINEGSDLPY